MPEWYRRLVLSTRHALEAAGGASGRIPGAVYEGYARGTMDQMYAAVESYHDKVRNLFLIVITMLGAAGLAGYSGFPCASGAEVLAWCLGALLMVMVWYTVVAGLRVCRAAYELYVGAVLHATVVHQALGFSHPQMSHPWFEHVLARFSSLHDGFYLRTDAGAYAYRTKKRAVLRTGVLRALRREGSALAACVRLAFVRRCRSETCHARIVSQARRKCPAAMDWHAARVVVRAQGWVRPAWRARPPQDALEFVACWTETGSTYKIYGRFLRVAGALALFLGLGVGLGRVLLL